MGYFAGAQYDVKNKIYFADAQYDVRNKMYFANAQYDVKNKMYFARLTNEDFKKRLHKNYAVFSVINF